MRMRLGGRELRAWRRATAGSSCGAKIWGETSKNDADRTSQLKEIIAMIVTPPTDGSSDPEIEDLWEVQDILAKRITLSGEAEFLVAWRSTWIAAAMVKDGPVLRSWYGAPKYKTQGLMAITLPLARGTQLYVDCKRLAVKRAAERSGHPSSDGTGAAASEALPLRQATGPRQELGSVAKRHRRK
jgi:hypothetical protein